MLAVIAAITFVLLFLLTGSVVLPLKALLLNVLSLSATFGALVWIFQDGHLGAFGTTATGTLVATIPVLLFCIAFGLSMDYEVFLVSRIREYWLTSGRPRADNDESVALGLARTGRVVTAAALVMSISFAALIAAQVSFMRMFGVGLTLAVLVDATLVRILLVPAFMHVLGRANWWAPKPLARLHARFGISEASTPEPTEAAMKETGQRVVSVPNPVGGTSRESDFPGQSKYLVVAGETDITTTEHKTTTIPIGTTTTRPETRSGQNDPGSSQALCDFAAGRLASARSCIVESLPEDERFRPELVGGRIGLLLMGAIAAHTDDRPVLRPGWYCCATGTRWADQQSAESR